MQNTAKQNYPGSVASYDTRPGNEMGLFRPEPTWGNAKAKQNCRYIKHLTIQYNAIQDHSL